MTTHEPQDGPDVKTLTLFSMLSEDEPRTFRDLKHDLRISDSLLSKRLGALSAIGLIQVSAETKLSGRRHKMVKLTAKGQLAYVDQSQAIRRILAKPT